MTTEPTAPGPVCKFEQGCHRVEPCEPGCGAPAAVSVPPPATQAVDRVAVLREAADDLATAFGDPMAKHIGALGAAHLRRRAREIEAGQAGEEQPETPLEKRLRYSERRNDELRTECKRRGKRVLEQSEKIRALEREVDEVRRQLGAEILRAGQAEDELRRVAAEAQPAKAEEQRGPNPDCGRCGGSGLDPYRYTEWAVDGVVQYRPDPCANCRPTAQARKDGAQPQEPSVVAYRSDGGRLLNCLRHVPPPAARHADFHPVTAEDLPDGGICTYPDCGVDVLIPQEPPRG
ncbi:DUF1674 domain-containing protein [Streptomyces scabiei]|uniref:DUF1674 domain-containing protein n=1 Tax=Streptomyces scabiei TaxID=1930 RepID=UPI001B317ABE|nr:DUF1674 domain-containing protein [Streptomyces sp. LBUM 1482]QTU45616.1 DUF1674 domain-containing protein [Streptomyces sp. LBUM 1482]